MDIKQNFIPRNDGFNCEACSAAVPPAPVTFRNHCPFCLTSKHVDNIPGDRANACLGLMKVIRIEGTDPDKLDLVHQCQTCQHTQPNKVAEDDDRSVVFGFLGFGI